MSAARVNTGLDHRAPPRTDETRSLPIALPWIAQRMARVVLRRRYWLEVHGAGLVPRSGPVLLSVNHIGYLDGPLLGAVAPRVSHALVKNEMFVGRTGRLLAAVGQIPVERLEMDPAAVRRCVRALRQRRVVVVFPEARRGGGEVASARRGVAYLALVTGAPVVPVAVLGTRLPGASIHSRPPQGSRLVVSFGQPVPVGAVPWPRRSDEVGALTERLRQTLADHVAATAARFGLALPGRAPDEVDDLVSR